DISSRKKSFIKQAIAYIKIKRQASRLTKNIITRDRADAHERLVAAFFPITRCISPLIKCTSAIRQLAYDVNSNFLYEYMQISERSSHMAFDHFCEAVMEIYGPKFLRKPTVTDIEKLYRYHEEKHGFLRMLGSLDCTDLEWFGCHYAFKGQYVRRDHGSNPFILLEAVASQDLWIWHAFFGVDGSNNDINILYQSLLSNDLKTGRAPEIILWLMASVTHPDTILLTGYIRNWRHSLTR
nr:hypothetical protein [Tanacetum cinerariifolium]